MPHRLLATNQGNDHSDFLATLLMHKDQITKVYQSEFSGNKMLAIFVLLTALFGVWNAFKFGSASFDYSFVRNTVLDWQNDINLQTYEQYLAVNKAINQAKARHPSHPLYADLSGQVKEWGVFGGFESEDVLLDAKADYLQAVQLRPSWPVTWASLALIKWRLQEFDDEMLHYLNMADKLGKQKSEVHVLFVQLGLALYQANHRFYGNIREQTKIRLVTGLRNTYSRQAIINAIAKYDAMEIACIWTSQRDEFVFDVILKCPKM